MYNLDLRRVGGFDLSIAWLGKEDADLLDKFLKTGIKRQGCGTLPMFTMN